MHFFYLRIAGQKVFRVVVVVVVLLLVRKDFKKLDKNKLALKNVFGFLFNHDQNLIFINKRVISNFYRRFA